jgi:hypothetical protein
LKEIPIEQAEAKSVHGVGNQQVTRRIFLQHCPSAPEGWENLRTVIRIDSEGFDRLSRTTCETFYFLSSLPVDGLSPEQWMTILQNPRLTVVIMILRRIGHTLLTIFKHVTQRSEQRHSEPWHVLLQRMRDGLLLATDEILKGLRRREVFTPHSLS